MARLPSDGRPAQLRQASRRTKSAWRKNIDISATEAALEDIREQERAIGAPAHTRKDSELFVVDHAGQETATARQARPKRKLRSQEILDARSAVPAVQSRARPEFQLDTKTAAGKANASGMSAKMKKRLRILASRPHTGIEGADEVRSAGRLQSDAALAEKHDLWAEPPKERNEWLEPTKRDPVHRPASKVPFGDAANLAAVPAPHPGMSYNPDADAHDELLHDALADAAAVEQDEADKRALKQQWQGVTMRPSDGEFMGMIVDDGNRDEDDQSQDDDDEDDDEDAITGQPRRKTKAQRVREARAKEQQLAAARRKQERIDRAEISSLPAERRKLTRKAAECIAAREARLAEKSERLHTQGIAGERFGKHRIPEQRKDVQTGDELSESLRQLKPEGNLFWDRFQSLQARGRAEPRRPIAPTRRKHKLRTYDSHYFKRD